MDIDQAIAEVHAAAARVDEAAQSVTAAKQRLQRVALHALLAVDGDEEAEGALVRRLYWDVPELAVKTLEAAVGTAAQVRQLAGSGPVLGDCDVCSAEVRATSRTHLTADEPRCAPCQPKDRHAPALAEPDDWHADIPPPGAPREWD